MQLACELPVNYQEILSKETDFDFILTHLVLENTAYKQFYINQGINTTRKAILDCSIFELGQALSTAKVLEAAEIVNPDVIISPDVIGDASATINNLEAFIQEYSSLLTERGWQVAAVLQGDTLEDLANMYEYYCTFPLVSCICFPFSMILRDTSNMPQDLARMFSRLRLTQFLEERGSINTTKWHHLLGVNLPAELLWQRKHSWITSVDTSAPIVSAQANIDPFKATTKLVRESDYFDQGYSVSTVELLTNKLHEFKQIII